MLVVGSSSFEFTLLYDVSYVLYYTAVIVTCMKDDGLQSYKEGQCVFWLNIAILIINYGYC